MSESFIVLTQPTTEPVTLQEAKDWMNIDFSYKDALISSLITRARNTCETATGRAFCPQQIREIYTIDRPQGGEISGPTEDRPNWYNFQQQIGANPFGPAQFYFDLAMPPFDTTQVFTIQTKVTAFDVWQTFPQVTNPDGSTNTWVDNSSEPARLYVMSPVTSNFYKFEYWTGYGTNTFPLAYDLKECLMELITLYFDNRESEGDIAPIIKKLQSKRIADAWI